MNRRLSCWFWSAVAVLCALPAGAAPFRVSLENDAVIVSGVTLKGQVVLLGVTREIGEDDFPTLHRHLTTLSDDDGDGVIRYPIESGIPLRSVWAVADLKSGDYDAVAPERFGVRRVNWRGRGLEHRNDGKDAVEDRRSLLELLVVRPGAGAWESRISDGDESDSDGVIDGRLQGVLDQMKPVSGTAPPPSVFQKDDLVLAIDPAALEITLVKVPASR
jgi:hypothetical protein